MAGRTPLQQAVLVSFGLVAAGWLTAPDQARTDLRWVSAERLAVEFGGAAGTLASLGEDGPAPPARAWSSRKPPRRAPTGGPMDGTSI